jgi:phosphohistidine phosphatase SixA
LDDCTTQRNLSDDGRRQARQIGAWFASRQLRPTRVRSSPWCRCLETARLAFGEPVEAWAALGSPHAGSEEINAQALAQLRAALASVVKRRVGFEVWVTHMFVFSALLGEGAGSGDAALLGLGSDGAPRVITRLTGFAA